MTTEKNVRGLAKSRGYKLHKIRSEWVEGHAYRIIVTSAVNHYRDEPIDTYHYTLEEAEEFLRKQPTLERGR